MADIYAKTLSGEHVGKSVRFRHGVVVIEGPLTDVCHFTVARFAEPPKLVVCVQVDGVQPKWEIARTMPKELDGFFDLHTEDIVTVELIVLAPTTETEEQK